MRLIEAKAIPHNFYGSVLCLHVADLPNPTELVYTYREPFFYAEHPTGLCNFYYWPGSNDGYAGKGITINTVDGPFTMRGPGSSRPGLLNAHGFGPCVQVVMSVSKVDFDRGHGFIGYVTLAFAEQVAQQLGIAMEKYDDDGDIIHRIARRYWGHT